VAKHGKRYRDLYSRVDREHQYAPAEAVRLVRGMQSAKFAETVECHVRTGLNVRHAEEQLRGTLTLPHMAGTDVTVVVFARGEKARDAEAAGADIVGDDDLAERIQGGWTDFDVAIASPDMMPVVGRLGRVLGPQGKMPNPKVGTVTEDVGRAVSEAKAGRMEYRTDRHAIVHLPIGKTNLSERELLENYAALLDEIVRAKPASAKGRYLRTITLATSLGPGVRVDPARTRDIVEELAEDGDAAAADAEPAAA
jgi:large subunit ribosomal protein L1